MSVQPVDQDNGNEQHNRLSETNDEDERWLRYKKVCFFKSSSISIRNKSLICKTYTGVAADYVSKSGK